MTDVGREERLVTTFATLADTLITDYDVLDLLQLLVDTCTEILDVAQAGILLADQNGDLELAASTSESSRLVEVMQLSAEAGPCIESFVSGQAVSVPDVALSPVRWAEFSRTALEQGFHSVYSLPMRLRDNTIGALNLMRAESGAMSTQDLIAAQAFADVATIGILQHRALIDSDRLNNQLQVALDSRVVIEQAKGVVAHTNDLSMDDAFTLIRGYARSHGLSLKDVASQLVNRQLRL
jgi:GAF domain-containing protein